MVFHTTDSSVYSLKAQYILMHLGVINSIALCYPSYRHSTSAPSYAEQSQIKFSDSMHIRAFFQGPEFPDTTIPRKGKIEALICQPFSNTTLKNEERFLSFFTSFFLSLIYMLFPAKAQAALQNNLKQESNKRTKKGNKNIRIK